MFYGVGLDSLKARFNRAAGLSASKKEELFHTLDLFRAPEPVEEEDEEFLPDEDDDDFDDFDS